MLGGFFHFIQPEHLLMEILVYKPGQVMKGLTTLGFKGLSPGFIYSVGAQ